MMEYWNNGIMSKRKKQNILSLKPIIPIFCYSIGLRRE